MTKLNRSHRTGFGWRLKQMHDRKLKSELPLKSKKRTVRPVSDPKTFYCDDAAYVGSVSGVTSVSGVSLVSGVSNVSLKHRCLAKKRNRERLQERCNDLWSHYPGLLR
ncbi:MAG: hypothetical protein ACRD6X_06690 [Pyrinomonadaceae bacterium]